MHVSLWENGENVFMASGQGSCYGISKVGEEFMAGVLHHLPSILAFTAPIPNRLSSLSLSINIFYCLFLYYLL